MAVGLPPRAALQLPAFVAEQVAHRGHFRRATGQLVRPSGPNIGVRVLAPSAMPRAYPKCGYRQKPRPSAAPAERSN